MRKLIDLCSITIDGVLQSPSAPQEDSSDSFAYGGWQAPYMDDFVGDIFQEQWAGPFDLLLGRKTFQIFEGYWPHHAEGRPGSGINSATKYVASNTLSSSPWEKSVFLKGDIGEEVRKLKQENGPDIHMYGSSELIQTLLKHDLIDEFWLKIIPITLGTGKRLFAEGTFPAAFMVTMCQVSPKGVIAVNLARAGDVKTGTVGE